MYKMYGDMYGSVFIRINKIDEDTGVLWVFWNGFDRPNAYIQINDAIKTNEYSVDQYQ